MKQWFLLLLLFPLVSLGQADFEIRFLNITATPETEYPTPALSAFQKKVKQSMYKTSYFSDFTNQSVTAQNFYQPVDMATSTDGKQPYSRVSMERLQASFGRSQLYGYTTDGKTRIKNQVYEDARLNNGFRNPYDPFNRYSRYNGYNPYARPDFRRTTIITIGGDN